MSIEVIYDPDQRIAAQQNHFKFRGIEVIENKLNSGYWAQPLTSVPMEARTYIERRNSLLIDALGGVVEVYRPDKAKYSPDVNLETDPTDVYMADISEIANRKYFFLPFPGIASLGAGAEVEAASDGMVPAFVLHDPEVRSTRMLPPWAVALSVETSRVGASRLRDVFIRLAGVRIGVGRDMKTGLLVPLGFEQNREVYPLKELLYAELPDLEYKYDGNKPAVRLCMLNPEILDI